MNSTAHTVFSTDGRPSRLKTSPALTQVRYKKSVIRATQTRRVNDYRGAGKIQKTVRNKERGRGEGRIRKTDRNKEPGRDIKTRADIKTAKRWTRLLMHQQRPWQLARYYNRRKGLGRIASSSRPWDCPTIGQSQTGQRRSRTHVDDLMRT